MFEIRKLAPTGTVTRRALVKPASGPCVWRDVTEPTYAQSPRGDALYRARLSGDYSLRELAKKLGMSPADLSAIENGYAEFADPADWDRVRDAISPALPDAPGFGGRR